VELKNIPNKRVWRDAVGEYRRSIAMQFSMLVRCKTCQGKGTIEIGVYVQEIMLIVLRNVEDGKLQKIPAIKQVRDAYGMGLKAAKELVEGAMEFYSAIEKNAQIPSGVGADTLPNGMPFDWDTGQIRDWDVD